MQNDDDEYINSTSSSVCYGLTIISVASARLPGMLGGVGGVAKKREGRGGTEYIVGLYGAACPGLYRAQHAVRRARLWNYVVCRTLEPRYRGVSTRGCLLPRCFGRALTTYLCALLSARNQVMMAGCAQSFNGASASTLQHRIECIPDKV